MISEPQVAYNLRLPGQYFDQETGKHYNYFRDYDPSIGRFIESDPIGLKGGANTFGYVSGNPIAAWDDFGLCETMFRFKTQWQLSQEGVEEMGSFNVRVPVYHYETKFSLNRGIRKNPLQPPLKPSMCYRHVGDNVTAIELVRNVQFWQNNKYRQTCTSCLECGSTGPLTCSDWTTVGAIDAREVWGTPWFRTRHYFEEAMNGPCVKVPIWLPGLGR